MKETKAYITCPVSHTRERLGLLPEIETIVKSKGIRAFVFSVGGTPGEIFGRDYEQIASSSLLIAEVSERSHGVGVEIGMSYCLGLRRILLIEKGGQLTKLILGMPETVIIEYESVDDLRTKISKELDDQKYHI